MESRCQVSEEKSPVTHATQYTVLHNHHSSLWDKSFRGFYCSSIVLTLNLFQNIQINVLYKVMICFKGVTKETSN